MEFNEKLQELRRQKGLTQEELAANLYVSRTAISKWESGRGYPSIDSLRAIAKFFDVTVDELISSDKALELGEADGKRQAAGIRHLLCALLDISAVLLLFLPLFAQRGAGGLVQSVSLLSLGGVRTYLKILYLAIVIGTTVWGVLMLALQNLQYGLWTKCKTKISFVLNGILVLVLVLSLQPYPAVFTLTLLAVKTAVMIKR